MVKSGRTVRGNSFLQSALQNRRPFVPLACAAVAGILAAEGAGPVPWAVPLALALALVALGVRHIALTLAAVCAAFFALHCLALSGTPGRVLATWVDAREEVPFEVVGTVIEEPVLSVVGMRPPREIARFSLRVHEIGDGGSILQTPAKILVRWNGPPPRYGDVVRGIGALSRLSPARNPGQFDEAAFYARKDIFLRLNVRHPADGMILERGTGNLLMAAALHSRSWIANALDRSAGGDEQVSGILRGMLLGEREGQSPETRELFRNTGTLHLFAVSGLHVGMVGLALWLVVGPFCRSRRQAIFLVIPILIFYAVVTGLRPSVVRATFMMVLVLAGLLVDRHPPLLNNLAAAAFLLLAVNTHQLFQSGFLLSFGVVLSILLFADRISRVTADWGVPDPFIPAKLLPWPARWWQRRGREISALLGVSSAAWLGSIGVTVYEFHLFTPVAVVANLVVVPMAFAVVGLGLLTLAAAPVWGALAAIAGHANWLAAHSILWVLAVFSAIPGGAFHVARPFPPAAGDAVLHVLDVGAGGSAILTAGSETWLIDAGSSLDYRFVVRPALQSMGINRLEVLVLTHGDSAHAGGGESALADFRPRFLLDSALKDRSPARKVAVAAAESLGIPRITAFPEMELPAGEHLRIRVLYPPQSIERRVADDQCVVLRIDASGGSVLMVGDSGFETEQWLMQNLPGLLRADILVMGRHTSDLSATPEFLEHVGPAAIVTTSADFPSAQRVPPHLENFAGTRQIPLLRLEETGSVQIRLGAGEPVVRPFLNPLKTRHARE